MTSKGRPFLLFSETPGLLLQWFWIISEKRKLWSNWKCKSPNTDVFDKCEKNSPFLIKLLTSFDNVIDYQTMQNGTIISWWHYFSWNKRGDLWNFISCKVTDFLFKLKFKNKMQFYNLLKRFSWKLFCNLMPLILGQGNKNCQKQGSVPVGTHGLSICLPREDRPWWLPSAHQIQVQTWVPWANFASVPENEAVTWSWWETVHSQHNLNPTQWERMWG